MKQGLKLEPVTIRCLMLGFNKSDKMYRLWNTLLPPSKVIIKARDVLLLQREVVPFCLRGQRLRCWNSFKTYTAVRMS